MNEVTSNFVKLKLEDLPPNDELRSQKPSAALIADIAARGVVVPIIITKHGDKYIVRAGRRRIKAARAAIHMLEAEGEKFKEEDKTIKAIIYNGLTEEEALMLSFAENEHRSENMITDVLVVRQLLKDGMTYKEIAQELNTPVSRIKQIDKDFATLGEKFFDLLENGKLAHGVAKKIAKLAPTYKQELLKIAEKNEKIVSGDIKAVKVLVREKTASTLELPTMEHDETAPLPEYVILGRISPGSDTFKPVAHGAIYRGKEADKFFADPENYMVFERVHNG